MTSDPMSTVNVIIEDVPLPRFVRVRQHLDAPALTNLEERVREQLTDARIQDRVQPGQRIGITAGSRGIADMVATLRVLATWVRERGATPVIIPAMGSHGGATAEGQRELLEHLGITPETVGAEIESSMEVVNLGTTPEGVTANYSRTAHEMDGVILCNRIKAHTDIIGEVESGLIKMTAVGLGKHIGALECHRNGLANAGVRARSIFRHVAQRANILFGVGILENALDRTRDVAVIPVEDIDTVEPQLLAESRNHLPRLLIPELDVLIVDRIGKDISGDGMDPNVIGRSVVGVKNPDVHIGLIVGLDLTHSTAGNAVGIGLLDTMTKRIFDQLDFPSMYTNGVTSNAFAGVRMPPFFDTQRLAIQAALRGTLASDTRALRVARIPDTLHLQEIWLSEALVPEASAHPDLVVLSDPADLVFDEHGDLFAH